jgi:MFS family permease
VIPKPIRTLWNHVSESIRDLAPIVLVIGFFQAFVLKQPIEGGWELATGALFVLAGLTMFIYGLELALFPIGESLAIGLAKKGSVFWLLIFAFLLGFGTTIAEPSLTAVATEASRIAAAAGAIADTDAARAGYVLGLRITVALSVGTAILVGVLRILFGWSLPVMIISGYVIVIAMTAVAPAEIIGIAYDSGGVTTSTVTVPLVTALGVGLATSLSGRNPMTDGFGLIAFASLTPMIFVMIYGSVIAWI